jgi:hypothetical protein
MTSNPLPNLAGCFVTFVCGVLNAAMSLVHQYMGNLSIHFCADPPRSLMAKSSEQRVQETRK